MLSILSRLFFSGIDEDISQWSYLELQQGFRNYDRVI